jgi:hypothetical protein
MDEAEALTSSSGVFVTRADELDGLLAEIISKPDSGTPGDIDSSAVAS